MKIAWFGHRASERGDGLITYSREITEGLRTRGKEVVFFYHGSKEERREGDQGLEIELSSLSMFHRSIFSSPGAKKLIENTLSEERVDIAHASLSFSLLDFSLPDLCHDMNIPIVATFHFPFDRRFSLWASGSRALYLLYVMALSKYDVVIIFSQGQKELLEGYGVPTHLLRVIPNGVDVEIYSPGPSNYKEEIGAELLIAYCGRIDPEKNVNSLLKVFQEMELPASHKLVIVGEGTDYQKLRDRYENQSNIIFTGLIADKAQYVRILRAADIFVLPSEVEGLSLAMLEAMACGLATIATDVGCDGEVLAGAGILLEPKNLETQLNLALHLLIDYPDFRQVLGRRARQRVVEEYSLETNIDRVVEVYQELLKGA
ncbi:MAG: glycosyltransferase family 4 protein [Anaerolineae bacterium]